MTMTMGCGGSCLHRSSTEPLIGATKTGPSHTKEVNAGHVAIQDHLWPSRAGANSFKEVTVQATARLAKPIFSYLCKI
jgi:hypothetical protein